MDLLITAAGHVIRKPRTTSKFNTRRYRSICVRTPNSNMLARADATSPNIDRRREKNINKRQESRKKVCEANRRVFCRWNVISASFRWNARCPEDSRSGEITVRLRSIFMGRHYIINNHSFMNLRLLIVLHVRYIRNIDPNEGNGSWIRIYN